MARLKYYNSATGQWEPAAIGGQGPAGPEGPIGPGVLAGGTTGQILAKTSDTDFDTQWVNSSEIATGTIMPTGSETVPSGWLLCNGAAVSRTTYANLFGAIGISFGAGNGTTTFNLPDLRGRVPVGKNGGSFGTLGATGGVESVTLTAAQSGMPNHGHSVYDPSHNHSQNAHSHYVPNINNGGSGGGAYTESWGGGSGNRAIYVNGTAASNNGAYTGISVNNAAAVNASEAHTNLQPYQVVNYIIKYTPSNVGVQIDSELTTRMNTIEAKFPGKLLGRTLYTEVDSVGRTFGTGWGLGWTTGTTAAMLAGSKFKLTYFMPTRNDSGSWGGGYIEPQISLNDGTWQSLGSCR